MADEALNIALSEQEKLTESLAYNLLSDCKFAEGLHKEALEYAVLALSIQEKADEPGILVRTLTQMANNNLRMSNYEECLNFYSAAEKIHQSLKNDSGIALIQSNLALVHKQLGNYEQSLQTADRAIRLYRRLKNEEGEARVLANKATVLFDQGKYVESIVFHLKALKIRERLNDQEGIVQSLGCVGISYNEMDKQQDALDYLDRALKISKKISNSYYTTHYLTDIAGIYSKQSQFAKSLEYSLQALEGARIGGVRSNEIYTLARIARTYRQMEDKQRSLNYAIQARDLAIAHGEKAQLLSVSILLGEIYLWREDFQLAREIGLQGLQFGSETDPVSDLAKLHALLHETFKAEMDWETALHHLEQSTLLNHEYLEAQSNEKFTKIQSRYESEKARREAELYRLKNVKLVKKNKRIKEQQKALTASAEKYRVLSEKLTESNGMKELLLDIVTHDLKNPAGVILGMGQMLQESLPPNEMLDVMISSGERLIKVLEHAKHLSMVSADEKISMDKLHLKTIVQSVLADFKSPLMLNKMTAELDIPENINLTANPLISEIFENYISNAIKYASSGRELHIAAHLEGDDVIIAVKDLGETIEEPSRKAVFQRTTQLMNGKNRGRGLGLAIVQKIALVHQGTCWVEPNAPRGNAFCVRLPLEQIS